LKQGHRFSPGWLASRPGVFLSAVADYFGFTVILPCILSKCPGEEQKNG
jgi:hypothetical protein